MAKISKTNVRPAATKAAAPSTATITINKAVDEPLALIAGKAVDTKRGQKVTLHGVVFTSPGGLLHGGSKLDTQWPDGTGTPHFVMCNNADGSGALLTVLPKSVCTHKVYVFTSGKLYTVDNLL